MPINKVEDLYRLCVGNILQNVDFWFKVKKRWESKGFRNSPFEPLPATVGQDLLEAYENNNITRRQSKYCLGHQDRWRLFVTQQVMRLCITEYTDEKSIKHVAKTCRNVKLLEFKNIQQLLVYLKALTPCLKSVQTLHFESMSHDNGLFLKYVRNHCSSLRVL